MILFNPTNYGAYHLLHDGILAFARAERQGMRIDVDYVNKKSAFLDRKCKFLESEFKKTAFFKDWQKSQKETVNIRSSKQLGDYLYNVKGIRINKRTTSDQGSTDAEALKDIGIPELESLIEIKKLEKVRDTYLKNFLRETVDGYIHPFFNLHTVITYRSSSDRPNFQNLPKRDEESMKIVRRAIFPRPGHQLMEFDFSGLEVRIAACYHKDENMLKYLRDPSSDMHGDMAKQLFKMDNFNKKIEGHSFLRQAAKNGFVFPEFYGSWYKNTAKDLVVKWGGLSEHEKWKMGQGAIIDTIGKEFRPYYLSDHLISKGIKSLGTVEKVDGRWVATGYYKYVQEVENDFWNNRFPQYKDWKELHWELYKKYGYFTTKTGFMCSGLMSKNDAINYPVQGSAFHLNLKTFITTDKLIYDEKLDTRLVGQIHDSIIADVNPDERDEFARKVYDIATKKIPELWDWIIVPLDIEAEICPVDGSWAEKTKYKFV